MTAPSNDSKEKQLVRLIRKARRLAVQNWRLCLCLICAAVFLYLLDEVLAGQIMRIDALAYHVIVENLRRDWLTPTMEGFSALATPVVLVVITLTVASFAPGRRPGWCCGVNLVLVAGFNVIIKALVRRPRPDGFRLVAETGFSFPSGHSMAAMAFYGLIVWLIWRSAMDRKHRMELSAVFALVIVLIGASRIYLGVHYASDVIGGFCAALIWLAFYTRMIAPFFLDERADMRGQGTGRRR